MSKKISTFIIILLIVGFVIMGYRYISFREANAVSNAAFIKSDRLAILSFKVEGKVVSMQKSENEEVRKGEVIARIDPVDLITSKKRIEENLNSVKQKTEALKLKRERIKNSLLLQSSISKSDTKVIEKEIDALEYEIKASKATLLKLQKDDKRYENMLKNRLIAKGDYESVHTQKTALSERIKALGIKKKALKENLQKVKKAYQLSLVTQKQILEIDKEIESSIASLKSLEAGLEGMKNKISYTTLYAPFDGIIAKKFIKAPRIVEKGTPIYALVDPKKLYCEVLLSEKKIHGVKKGNHVKVTVDAIEDKTYEGEVESIAPTSASTFSLVPRDIASGEFTKLDQRFIVRIKLKDTNSLRTGMGASVAIERGD